MITNKKKSEKTTIICFDETKNRVDIQTHNTALKRRLLDFAAKHPDLCYMYDDDECGCLCFKIEKSRLAYRITEPYTEKRRALARAKMNEINNKEDIG